ncbi:MAG: PadR family transcriptional regulator [Chloroflexota bacterium]|nr:PadR family transcriptional regulator [Chloroflexota bacterium]
MSIEKPTNATAQLTPTSYLVLGLLAREGPSTPYDLKRHVAATIGHFWSFPHALLYKEPPRLVELGLLTEEREQDGRRRRLFTITHAGRQALRGWLGRPAREPTELRDLALLQLFFADLEPTTARLAIAQEQLALHRAQLAGYESGLRFEDGGAGPGLLSRSIEHWRGVTLRMGLLYERAAVEFWAGVATHTGIADAATAPARGDDGGVAKAADFVSGRAHGQAVSTLAKTHGAEVSAAARAKGAANAAAGKAKGAAAAAAGKVNGATASESGRLKAACSRGL